MSDARTVHIVDDDTAIRDSLEWMFSSRGLPTSLYDSAEDFLHRFRVRSDAHVNCLVLDVRMDGMTGTELQDRLIADGIPIPIVFLTGHGSVPIAVSALRKGAIDFIEKPFNGNDLVDRVIACLDNESRRRRSRSRHDSVLERIGELTVRDREVMQRVLDGKYNKVIADELGISMRTVEVHRSAILRKIGAKTAVELAKLIAESDPNPAP